MTTKNMAYDHAAYLARLPILLGPVAAGSGGVTSKFTVFANTLLFSITAAQVTAGTSTYTLWNGTATTTAIAAQSYSLIRVFNTATLGATPSLATATFGPFVNSVYNGTATATQTNAIGSVSNVALWGTSSNGVATGTGVIQSGTNGGTGGYPVNQGDVLYVVSGTDTSGVASFTLEAAIVPLANVTA